MTPNQAIKRLDTQQMFSREKLVVTMPALYRPEVLATTLWSFERGLFRQFPRRTLILNVDPLGVAPDSLEDKKIKSWRLPISTLIMSSPDFRTRRVFQVPCSGSGNRRLK